ncbi:hypothetical protein ACFVWZ_13715 [Streptomyces sp. NPDC058200]|uniref:hypothetical protein n=1 Tax=Streptomyces sp. NPDC058200 TaxID=3346378 RepID=UPI0036EEF5F7
MARAAVFSGVCVVTTALGHAMAGGQQVTPGALVGAFLLVVVLVCSLPLGEQGPCTVLGATAGVQLGLHVFFSFLLEAAPGDGAPPVPLAGHAHTMAADRAQTLTDGLGPAGHAHLSGGMVAAHIVAALACGLWLWRGEAALFGVLRLLRYALPGPLARKFALPRPLRLPELPRLPVPVCLREPATVLLQYAMPRRGPPPVPARP